MAVPLTLKVFKGETLVTSKDFERDIIKIGRLSSAHLCLEDEKVSRIHSVIEVGADGSLSIIDMGSVEGTYVNGKRVNKGKVTFGDEIRLGGTTIRLENPAAVAAVNLAAAVSSSDETTKIDLAQASDAPLASGLAQAAAVAPPEAVAAPVAAPAPAMDASFASTERHEVVAPGYEAPPAEQAAPRVRTVRRTKASGPLGASLSFLWGDQRVGEFFLAPGKPQAFSVGSAAGADFIMGDSKLGGPCLEVMRTDGQTFNVCFTGKMKGELVRKDETLDLTAVIESGKTSSGGDGGAYSLALEPDDFFWVDLGGVTMEVSFQAVPKRVHVPLADSVDYRALNIFLLMFFAGTMFVISAMNRSGDGDEFADELSGNNARLAKLIIKPPENQKNKFLEKLNQQKEKKKAGELAAKQKKDEGQMGKKDAPKTANRTAPQGQKDKKDEARALTQKIFGGKGGVATIFGSKGLGGDLKNAMGNMFGAKTGDSGGLGGLGIRGSGGGGGGTGDTIGIGGIGTKGRGGGTSAYGSGAGVLGGKQSVDVGITSSEPMVMGSLDKELIRQVIQRNRSQIRFCYESQLTKYPKLAGKVAIKFVINAEGKVVSSDVAQSTAGNAELERCVAGRVRTWQFPKPKGGGVVIVTYPFNFKASGE
ncbi:MAG: adventurous gliding motility protein GltG [Myxococcaceae bacterium]|nr:adventurous gliding motility protein GltG [Myxococcaceae bacterium]